MTGTITDPAVAAAHVAVQIAEGDRFSMDILIREDAFAGDASAQQAITSALTAHNMIWPAESSPVRVDVPARWDIHGLCIDLDRLELPTDAFITAVISLTSPFELDAVSDAQIFSLVHRAIEAHADRFDAIVSRHVFHITRER